jgi:hypothetical protein
MTMEQQVTTTPIEWIERTHTTINIVREGQGRVDAEE